MATIVSTNRDFLNRAALPVLVGAAEALRSQNQNLGDVLKPDAVANYRATARASCVKSNATAALLLGYLNATNAVDVLVKYLQPGTPEELERAAIRSLTMLSPATLVSRERWLTYTPGVKETVLARLPIPILLSALEDKSIPAGAIDSARRRQWTEHRDEAIRERARTLFKNLQPGDRMKVYEDYKSVVAMKPEPRNGKAIFAQQCASCHRLDREGVAVGPDLFGIRNQSKEAILLHILVPEYEIQPGFAGYEVETKDGRVLAGIIAAESAASITLRRAQGEEETIPRDRIVSLSATGLSLMPQELEKNMSRQDLADLVAYLKGEL
jgi:putative heme-binding domain-containing protein